MTEKADLSRQLTEAWEVLAGTASYDEALGTLTARMLKRDHMYVAGIAASALLQIADLLADDPPSMSEEVTDWAWRDPGAGFTKELSGNRASAAAATAAARRLLGEHIEALTRTYIKGSTPPDWTVLTDAQPEATP